MSSRCFPTAQTPLVPVLCCLAPAGPSSSRQHHMQAPSRPHPHGSSCSQPASPTPQTPLTPLHFRTLGQYPSLASCELQNSQAWPRALDKCSWMNEEKLGGRVHNKGGTGLGGLSWVGARAQDPAGPRAISARLGAGLVSERSGGERCTGQHRRRSRGHASTHGGQPARARRWPQLGACLPYARTHLCVGPWPASGPSASTLGDVRRMVSEGHSPTPTLRPHAGRADRTHEPGAPRPPAQQPWARAPQTSSCKRTSGCPGATPQGAWGCFLELRGVWRAKLRGCPHGIREPLGLKIPQLADSCVLYEPKRGTAV